MITVTIYRSKLEELGACSDGLALYDRIAAMQSESDTRKWKRLKIRWTRLHRVWLAGSYPSFCWWLYERDLVIGAYLRGAYLGEWERDTSSGLARRKVSS